MTVMVRELLRLFVDTIWPRCLACGRRKWSTSADLECQYRHPGRCHCPPSMLAVGAYRRDCPIHEPKS